MRTRTVAAFEVVLIFPALLFLASLAVRSLEPLLAARAAQQVVLWYARQMWTLWLLLLALPFAALVTGCATLLRRRNDRALLEDTLAVIRTQPAALIVAVTTLAAAAIVVIVILHMAAN